jgi:succinate dehydrogenase / fumarate reductase cytochrome b subunit
MTPPVAEYPAPSGAARPRGWVRRFYASAIGMKVVMALTGLVMVGYLVVHLLGNLLVFAGSSSINRYAEFLRGSLPLLWGTRAVLLLSLVLHVHAALALTRLAARARPERYHGLKPQASTHAARLMRVGGVVLLAFVIFHLLHLTTGSVHPDFLPGDVYRNIVLGLGVAPVAGFYLVAMVALALHLQHGVWSLFQTLGFAHPHLDGVRRGLARGLAVVLGVGFAIIPIAVLSGLLR